MAAEARAGRRRMLFGTDGVRGVAGELLTAELALGLARAATHGAIERGTERPRVLIVRDTRESGDMLETACAAGVAAAGGDALLGGVLPTPAAPLLVRRYGLELAVVLSASHNPYRDNGIKFFGPDGHKLSDEREAEFDGDADRVLAVDRTGALVDGDELIALAAPHLRDAGRLPGGGVAVTVMANYGLHTALRAAGIEVATTSVGDRYVLDELRARGWA